MSVILQEINSYRLHSTQGQCVSMISSATVNWVKLSLNKEEQRWHGHLVLWVFASMLTKILKGPMSLPASRKLLTMQELKPVTVRLWWNLL